MDDVVNALAGLVIGLLTGYFFERRSTRSARQQSAELAAELDQLRASIYAAGRGDLDSPPPPVDPSSIAEEVLAFLLRSQDFAGRVARANVMRHFTAAGYSPQTVDAGLETLVSRDSVSRAGQWIEVK